MTIYFQEKTEHNINTINKLHILHNQKNSIMFDTNIFSSICYNLYPNHYHISKEHPLLQMNINLQDIKQKYIIYISSYQKQELEKINNDNNINDIVNFFNPEYTEDINILPTYLPFTFFNTELLTIFKLIEQTMQQRQPNKNHHIDARIATICILNGIKLVSEDKVLIKTANKIFQDSQSLINKHRNNNFKAINLKDSL